jgi:ribosomal protein L37E
MGKPTGRHHFPCRRCGEAHTNPASSTICDTCGNAEHSIELINKAVAAKADKFSADAHVLINLRTECGLSMKDADTFLKAFRICMENING